MGVFEALTFPLWLRQCHRRHRGREQAPLFFDFVTLIFYNGNCAF